ncbi:MAG: hypothetical protein Q7V01_09525 [Vicinamibacterales bacterium]|nr:hypothetical protein [Vicinamibacterales bacterium]
MHTRSTRRFLALGLVLLVAAGVLGFVLPAEAQTPYVPYFGKNLVRYDRFDWQIYTTEHFQIYYYPETQRHIERVAGYAESAYQHISAELKHDLAFKVPMILFKTHAEFEQQNVIPGAAQEGVGAFAESSRNRMLLPLDEPPDLLYRLITHELTHVFQFDIIPQSLIRQSAPLWVMEGLSDYMTGIWRPVDLMTVRDSAIADIIPKMSEMEGYGGGSNPRLVYNLGHAAMEFMESRWGKEGIRQFLFSLRKSVVGGGEGAYMEAFQLEPEEFDQQFDRYLKARFKPFRDKETPADYGRNLAPKPKNSDFVGALTVEPSPSGDILATVTLNMKDREVDIVLVSAKDGKVIRNLTSGFDQSMGFDYLATPGGRWTTIPWMAWAPAGDRLAYVVRRERSKVLIVQNVVTRKIEQRIDLKSVDDPESPVFSPDGRRIAFSAMREAVADIFAVDLATQEVTNLTNDDFADYGPSYSPDGSFIVYMARISGNEKLFRLDLASGQKTQLTFGTHDDAAARFIDDDTIVFSSTAADPNLAVEADVARNGATYNLWTLGLKTGELRQWTDAIGGNFSPVVLRDGKATRIAFVSYYKGEYGLHMLDRKEPLLTARTEDFGAPGPVIDFQAPLTHTFMAENKKKKGAWANMSLDGRPPITAGVTSGGDLFGGTAISFTDVLGDRRVDMYAASMSQYRQFAASLVNQSRRFQYALQGYWMDTFFYGQTGGVYYDPIYSPYIDRDLATATRSNRGLTAFGLYPLSRYSRVEMSAGLGYMNESYNDPVLADIANEYQQDAYGQSLFRSGYYAPMSVAFVQETTIFREFGPLTGRTLRASYEFAPKVKDLSWQSLELDVRKYFRLFGSTVLAVRGKAFRSWGETPDFTYFGGNSEMRGFDYLEFVGQKAFFANAELRLPLVHAMATPIGVVGGIRGVAFFNIGGAWFDNAGYKFSAKDEQVVTPVVGLDFDAFGFPTPVYGQPMGITGFRLVDGRASYGIGLETFALGFPIHFDWSWRTLFNKTWEDALFAANGGSEAFRKPRFQFWIGFDF